MRERVGPNRITIISSTIEKNYIKISIDSVRNYRTKTYFGPSVQDPVPNGLGYSIWDNFGSVSGNFSRSIY